MVNKENIPFFVSMFLVLILSISTSDIIIDRLNDEQQPIELTIEGNKIISKDDLDETNSIENTEIKFYIDELACNSNMLYITGWAILPGENAYNDIKLLLRNDEKAYIYNTKSIIRKDVTSYFNDGTSYDSSGFEVNEDLSKIVSDEYHIYIVIEKEGKYNFIDTGEKVQLQ